MSICVVFRSQFFFFNDGEDFADESNTMTLGNVFKFLVAKGLPQGTATDYMITSISIRRIILDLGFFISILLILNILKGKFDVDLIHFFMHSLPNP